MHWFLDPITKHYADFSGRSTRQEYWMFVLAYLIIYFVLSFVEGMVGTMLLSTIFMLAILVPSVALAARRLHDIGKSGWWQLISLIPVVGWIIAIIWLATKGLVEDNEYGPSLYNGSVPPAPAAPVASVPDAPTPEAGNEVADEPVASAPEAEENKQQGYGN